MSRFLEISKLTVRTGRLVIEVRIPDARFRTSTPALAAELRRRYPELPYHACVNPKGSTFGAVMDETDIPHVLEHVIISEMTRASSDEGACFVGTTQWISERDGYARIEVGFKDDLSALRALKTACDALEKTWECV